MRNRIAETIVRNLFQGDQSYMPDALACADDILKSPEAGKIRRALDHFQGIIESTYAHDEETGERLDETDPEFSSADIVEFVMQVEGIVDEAIEAIGGIEGTTTMPADVGSTVNELRTLAAQYNDLMAEREQSEDGNGRDSCEQFRSGGNAMKYVESKWKSFAASCVPAPPGSTQYEEMRKAFYAGGVVIIAAVEVTGDPRVPEEAGATFLQDIGNELRSFMSEIRSAVQTPVVNPDPDQRKIEREAHKDKLRCESTGYDDESCLAVLNRYGVSSDVAVALFRMMQQSEMPNQMALGLSLLAHKAALEAIKDGVGA